MNFSKKRCTEKLHQIKDSKDPPLHQAAILVGTLSKKSSTTGEPHQTFNWRETQKPLNPNLALKSKGSLENKVLLPLFFSNKKE